MWLAWVVSALAGSVYVNGINVDALRGQTFEDVTVMVDGKGDVWIYAPGYEIQLVDPRTGQPIQPKQGPVPPAAAPSAPVAPPAATAPVAPVAPAPPVAPSAPVMAAPSPPELPSAIPAPPAPRPPVLAPPVIAPSAARWWLVTEDNGSTGHTIEVYVNGTLAHTVTSGAGQQILDISDRLRPGANAVRMQSNSVSAAGGAFYVYVGRGSNDSGTVILEKPEIQYGLGASRKGPYSRDYQLLVP